MDHYIDIKLLPDAELRENVLMNKLYTKFHKALFDLNTKDIGVSFPDYKLKLGKMIRVHSTKERLLELQASNWIGGLKGYCELSEINPVPDKVLFRTICRKSPNMTQSKLRRLIKRGGINAEDIKKYKAKMFSQGLTNPFVELESISNGHRHRRFIEFSEFKSSAVLGDFDQFGLSKEATIPWF